MNEAMTGVSAINNDFHPSATDTTKKAVAKDKDLFLTMLVAQLKNQDPLSPLDATEYVSQIATFTQVEQLTSMNEQMGDLKGLFASSLTRLDLGYIGMEVESKLNSFSYKSGDTEFRYATAGAETVEIQIIDATGEVVRKIDGSSGGGEQAFVWDGKTNVGGQAEQGDYKVVIKALDANGNEVGSVLSMKGIVSEVITEHGLSILVYENGTNVESTSVVAVKKPLMSGAV